MASRRELTGILDALIRAIENADSATALRSGSTMSAAKRVLASAQKGDIAPLPWTPLIEVTPAAVTRAQIAMVMRAMNCSEDAAMEFFADLARGRIGLWTNDAYLVDVRRSGDFVHISVKRIDQAPVRDWRDLQRIKDQIVGSECEAVELYPADSRLVDSANQFHLWAIPDPTYRFPFGFDDRLVDAIGDPGPHHQRPREP